MIVCRFGVFWVCHSEPVPDHSTLWRFREQLAKSGLAERAFALITAQIEGSGFVLRRGTLIDASLVRSAVNPPEPPAGTLPPDADGRPASKLVRSPLDPEAAWTHKEGKYYFGYKMHVAMDQDSRIIRRIAFTPANVNESTAADALICSDEASVYADKAYDSKARRAYLSRWASATASCAEPIAGIPWELGPRVAMPSFRIVAHRSSRCSL